MNRYSYQARNSQGELVTDEIMADSVAQAVIAVEQLGLTLQSIQQIHADEPLAASENSEFRQRLETAIQECDLWLPALTALADEIPNTTIRRRVQKLTKTIRDGMSVEQVLSNRETAVLLPLFVGGIESKAGAAGLLNWLTVISGQVETRVARRNAIIYPIIVFVLALLLLFFFSLTTIPIYRSIFYGFGITLPAPTEFVFDFTDLVTTHLGRTIFYLLSFSLAAGIATHYWRKNALTNRLLGRFVAGSSSNLSAMAALTSTLAELLSLRAPLPDALRIAGRSSQHHYYQTAAEQLAAATEVDGLPLPQLPYAHRFPPMVLYAIQRPEDGLPSIPLLRELSMIYGDRTRNRINWFSDVLPVFAVLSIGAIVLFMIIAIFMPMTRMITSLA